MLLGSLIFEYRVFNENISIPCLETSLLTSGLVRIDSLYLVFPPKSIRTISTFSKRNINNSTMVPTPPDNIRAFVFVATTVTESDVLSKNRKRKILSEFSENWCYKSLDKMTAYIQDRKLHKGQDHRRWAMTQLRTWMKCISLVSAFQLWFVVARKYTVSDMLCGRDMRGDFIENHYQRCLALDERRGKRSSNETLEARTMAAIQQHLDPALLVVLIEIARDDLEEENLVAEIEDSPEEHLFGHGIRRFIDFWTEMNVQERLKEYCLCLGIA